MKYKETKTTRITMYRINMNMNQSYSCCCCCFTQSIQRASEDNLQWTNERTNEWMDGCIGRPTSFFFYFMLFFNIFNILFILVDTSTKFDFCWSERLIFNRYYIHNTIYIHIYTPFLCVCFYVKANNYISLIFTLNKQSTVSYSSDFYKLNIIFIFDILFFFVFYMRMSTRHNYCLMVF